MADARDMASAEEARKIIGTYFTSMNPLELKAFPPKVKRKLVILQLISEQFEAGRRYTEKEVNDILRSIYEDHTTIRRSLIDYGFMERTRDCGEYWLKCDNRNTAD